MITIPLEPFFAWLAAFLRVGMILGLFPLIGEAFVPVRVRLLMAVAVSLALAPVLPVSGSDIPLTAGGMVGFVAAELLLASGVAIIARIMFGIVQFSGQIAGEQMGFGMINAIDPTGSHQISVVAELQYILAILIFLTADLHHFIFVLLVRSYEVLPPGGAALVAGDGVLELVRQLGTVMFSLSLGFAMPVILTIFAINIGLGMIARAVPSINVFMESFPLRIIAGLAVLMASLGYAADNWMAMFIDMEAMMSRLPQLLRSI